MDSRKLSSIAAAMIGVMMANQSHAMEIAKVKGADGKEYFCANATCAGNSECMGAGNVKCGGSNLCAKTDQKYHSGWNQANDKTQCEGQLKGKWVLYKKEHSLEGGNVAPLKVVKKPSKK